MNRPAVSLALVIALLAARTAGQELATHAAGAAPRVETLVRVGPLSQPGRAQDPFDSGVAATPRNGVDQAVFARLKRLNLRPANVCSDAVFLRRAYLDVIGTIPTAEEASGFLADPSPDKRRTLVDRLLARREFADYWAMRWGDVLRVKSEFPINLWPNAVQAYHEWIRASLSDNVPYDRFVRSLLTESGSNFRVPPVNFYRAVQARDPQSLAAAVALTFMGARVQAWPRERLASMSLFFSQVGYKSTGEWKEEIVFFDPDKRPASTPAGAPLPVTFPDGSIGVVKAGQDPRVVFVDWLTAPANPWFARAAVNRLWYWLVGRGIVHEPDDIRPDNPPSNPELLAVLERELVNSRYDLKAVMRLILNSAVYELSTYLPADTPESDAQFAHAIMRPLDAEVLVDAVCQITGTSEQYSSAIPEPYTFVPRDVRSIALGDASITSTFLETFGRSPRDTGLASERATLSTASERLYLLNSSDIQRRLQQGSKLQTLLQGKTTWREATAALYLAILSRVPTDEEVAAATAYAQKMGGNRRVAAQDIAWALINSAEFRYRH